MPCRLTFTEYKNQQFVPTRVLKKESVVARLLRYQKLGILRALTDILVNCTRCYWRALALVTAAGFVLYYVTGRLAMCFFSGT